MPARRQTSPETQNPGPAAARLDELGREIRAEADPAAAYPAGFRPVTRENGMSSGTV